MSKRSLSGDACHRQRETSCIDDLFTCTKTEMETLQDDREMKLTLPSRVHLCVEQASSSVPQYVPLFRGYNARIV